jgi:ATP-dependent Clp protease ATP-binding subunit ClpB
VVDPVAMDWIIDKGFDPLFGARPLKRTVKRHVEEALADQILRGAVNSGGRVRIIKSPDKDRLDLMVEEPGNALLEAQPVEPAKA